MRDTRESVAKGKETTMRIERQEGDTEVRGMHGSAIHGGKAPTVLFNSCKAFEIETIEEQIEGTIYKCQGEELSTYLQSGLNKNCLYYIEVDPEEIIEKIKEITDQEILCRLGVNLGEEHEGKTNHLLKHQVSLLLCGDREPKEWVVHYLRAMEFMVYIDPVFQPRFVNAYRSLYRIETESENKRLELIYEKAMENLSEAECRILEKILEGKSNRKIAEECYLAVATVNNHVSHLTKKMAANDRTHTIKRAIESGWVKTS
ncbi:response regulator transcription factor [Thalassobacillus sp. C254]|uniref:response regulator transcription factor n=1 Tax=Thalassobacillus sp. C254 TaxID=1225341 RepID=UPI0006D028A8|nr:LuxR C-terminal-related transcriptional regulator [Thalassobacillus sp. C254]